MADRLSFGFGNPNHAAALACALLPLCWGWRRAAWAGRTLSAALFASVLLTQSRTGILVAALEWAAWRLMSAWGNRDRAARRQPAPKGAPSRRHVSAPAALRLMAPPVAAAAIALWRMWPRLSIDGSILNRPLIWLSGLRLFAANPDGVGLGNSGAIASAYLLPDRIPEIRTLVGSHLTLIAECGWIAGWAWLASVLLALCGVRRSPRVGRTFACRYREAGGMLLWRPHAGGHEPDASSLALARELFAAVADGVRCAVWGEDDTRRVMPRTAIDPEFLNPLFSSRMAELWRRDAP